MLRGLARQLTSLSAFAEARLANGVLQGGTAMDCVAPVSCAAARFYSSSPSSPSNQQFKNMIYNRSPEPLEFLRPHWAPAPGVEESLLKRTMLRVFGFYSREATYMRAAQGLYDSITEVIDDKRLMQALELPDDFQHMHSLLSLHVWLLLGRLRAEGKSGKQLGQQLYDNFQDDVEKRVRGAGVKVRLHKQLVELEKQFYGSCFAYDKALKGEGNEDFPAALHRNVYQKAVGSKDAAALLARYVKREMACLALTDSTALFAGNLRLSAMRLFQPEGGTPAEPPVATTSSVAAQIDNSGSAAPAAAST